jgi:hypothetical protein
VSKGALSDSIPGVQPPGRGTAEHVAATSATAKLPTAADWVVSRTTREHGGQIVTIETRVRTSILPRPAALALLHRINLPRAEVVPRPDNGREPRTRRQAARGAAASRDGPPRSSDDDPPRDDVDALLRREVVS